MSRSLLTESARPGPSTVHVVNVSAVVGDPRPSGYSGLVGLGPSVASVVEQTAGGPGAGPMMDRIFQQNLTTQNYISFLLSRDGDPGDAVVGQLSVSEPIPGYEFILQQTKLPVLRPSTLEIVELLSGQAPEQHWTTYTDPNGVIGPDGQPIPVSSLVKDVPKDTVVAVFDSGFTFPQVSRSISDAIYGRVQGAIYNTTDGFWMMPCAQELNVSFVFGGQSIPVHPLDLALDDPGNSDPPVNGTQMCIGAVSQSSPVNRTQVAGRLRIISD